MIVPLLPRSLFDPLPQIVAPIAREVDRVSRLRDPRSLYSYCFCSID